jgi:hypothetical protein
MFEYSSQAGYTTHANYIMMFIWIVADIGGVFTDSDIAGGDILMTQYRVTCHDIGFFV